MTVLQLFKSSFFRFKDLAEARKISFIKIIGYLVLLSAFLAIPITFQVSRIIDDVQKDGQAIAEKIPDFTIQNGTLTPEKQRKVLFIKQIPLFLPLIPKVNEAPMIFLQI